MEMHMFTNLSNRQRSAAVGAMIILAYAMLTYTITNNLVLGIVTDLIAGFAVILIPILMLPLFATDETRGLNIAYMGARFIEGGLMVAGGIMLAIPSLQPYRNSIYEFVHIWFFIAGAVYFYILLYRTRIVPPYIAAWGFIAALALLLMMILNMLSISSPFLAVLVLPIVLNELYLAVWLMVKGFRSPAVR